jgi:polar amino acid transport system substrate-binding protein
MKKNNLKKWLAAGLVVVLGSALLAGCSGSSSTSTTTTTTEKVTEESSEETDQETQGDTEADATSSGGDVTVIKAATGGSPKPYIYVGDDNEVTGYDAEVLKAVFDRLPQYELQFEVTDFGSVFSGLNSSAYQIGVNNFSYNTTRAESYLYSYPYDKISYVFVTRNGDDLITSFSEAAGKTMEGNAGVSVTTAVENWNEKNPDQQINFNYTEADTAVTLQHLEDGSVDLAIIDWAMYVAYVDEYGFDFQYSPVGEEETKMIADNTYAYYIFPKDQAELREEVDAVLKELKEDGTLTKISEEFFGSDTAPEDDRFEETLN